MQVRNVEPAIERAGSYVERRNLKSQKQCIGWIRHSRKILAGHLHPCGIAHKEDVVRIDEVLCRMSDHKLHRGIDVFKLCRKSVLRRKTIREVDNRKSPLCETHTVETIEILVTIYIAAAVHAHNNRKRSARAGWITLLSRLDSYSAKSRKSYTFSKPLSLFCLLNRHISANTANTYRTETRILSFMFVRSRIITATKATVVTAIGIIKR